jgi:hypothetical protein
MGNTNSGESKPINSVEQNQNIMVNQPTNVWKHAVNGDTEELNVKPKPTHTSFESTTENIFTQSEPLVAKPVMNGGLSETSEMKNFSESNANLPYYKEYMEAKTQYLQSKKINENLSETSAMENYTESKENQPYYKQYMDIKRKYLNTKNMNGGYIFNKISSLLQDTEVEFSNVSNLSIDSKLNQIRSLLQDSETNQNSNNLVGSQQLRDLLLQDTETFMNFRGGNSKKEKMKHIKETTEEESEAKKSEESEAKKSEESEAKKSEAKESEAEESEAKESEAEEKEEEEEEENKKSEENEQSGGEELDTELKVILKELQINNKNSHKGGKSSRKSSKKSKKSSKKQSKRTTESEMTNGTYDVDSESGNDNDYLTSTESMNTSDINIGHYRE